MLLVMRSVLKYFPLFSSYLTYFHHISQVLHSIPVGIVSKKLTKLLIHNYIVTYAYIEAIDMYKILIRLLYIYSATILKFTQYPSILRQK